MTRSRQPAWPNPSCGSATLPHMLDRRVRTALVVFAVAMLIAFVEAMGFYLRNLVEGHPVPWATALIAGLALWLSMAAAAPIPLAMAGRFPLERGTMLRRIPLH